MQGKKIILNYEKVKQKRRANLTVELEKKMPVKENYLVLFIALKLKRPKLALLDYYAIFIWNIARNW